MLVFAVSKIFEIGFAVIGLVAVFMVHFLSAWAWAKERFCYKTVDIFGCSVSEDQAFISTRKGLKTSQMLGLRVPNAAQVGDFIFTLKAYYGFPCFL